MRADVTPEMQGWLAKAGWRWEGQQEGLLQGQVRGRWAQGTPTGPPLVLQAPAAAATVQLCPRPRPTSSQRPRPPRRCLLVQGPAATWAEREAAGCALLHFQLGLPLELYAPHEFLQLYW